jgi:hypothetical protein
VIAPQRCWSPPHRSPGIGPPSARPTATRGHQRCAFRRSDTKEVNSAKSYVSALAPSRGKRPLCRAVFSVCKDDAREARATRARRAGYSRTEALSLASETRLSRASFFANTTNAARELGTTERRQSVEKPDKPGLVLHQIDRKERRLGGQYVRRTRAHDLVGDTNSSALRVDGLRCAHENSVSQPRPTVMGEAHGRHQGSNQARIERRVNRHRGSRPNRRSVPPSNGAHTCRYALRSSADEVRASKSG